MIYKKIGEKKEEKEYRTGPAANLAFKRAEASGRTKVCTSVGVVAFSSSAPDPKEGRISDKEFCFSGASTRTSEEII